MCRKLEGGGKGLRPWASSLKKMSTIDIHSLQNEWASVSCEMKSLHLITS